MNKNVKKKRKGFTLIELIIVLAIMAIIAAIAIPNFTAVRNNSRNKADVQSAETIKRTTMMLVADGTIKPGTSDITIEFKNGTTVSTDVGAALNSNGKDAFVEAMHEVKEPQGTVASGTTNVTASKYRVVIDTSGNVTVTTIQ